ncbi:MAG: hypothetical protein LBJ00_17750 [Planctomycetaceae bacterium]|nr:hypothetical protein [Planctomycetaceae bacterium]
MGEAYRLTGYGILTKTERWVRVLVRWFFVVCWFLFGEFLKIILKLF